MFEIIFYAIFLTTTSLCAYDIYQTSSEDTAYAECSDTAYNFDANDKLVYSTHHFNLKNNNELTEKFKVTYSICPINYPCSKKTQSITIYPHQQYYSNTWNLYTTFNQKTTGNYYYRVITDIKGYKNLHTEKTCKVRLING